MNCPNCNQKLSPGGKFCPGCGTKLQTQCVSCNSELPSGAKFCPSCGTPAEAAPQSSSANSSLLGYCAGSAAAINHGAPHFKCMSCSKLYTEPYRFEDHPMCKECAYRDGVAQQLEKERSIEREMDAEKRAEKERLAAEQRAREQQKREKVRLRVEKEAARKARRESLVRNIERYLEKSEYESAEEELVLLASHLGEEISAEQDVEYLRLQSFLEEAKANSKPHICPITGMEFVIISGGVYSMGDVWGDMAGERSEPVHRVELKTFQLAKYLVTQSQWLAVMKGENPSDADGGWRGKYVGQDMPVVNISWDDAQEFIECLNRKTNYQFNYRLPSEAEWEYAARSCGNLDKWSGTNDKANLSAYAHCAHRVGSITHSTGVTIRVGQKRPNVLGLYDLSGNATEWCQDVWHDNYKGAPSDGSAWLTGGLEGYHVIRGGSYGSAEMVNSTVFRWRESCDFRFPTQGFRIVKGN